MTDVLIREPVKTTHRGKAACDGGGGEWDDVHTRQGTPELDATTGS